MNPNLRLILTIVLLIGIGGMSTATADPITLLETGPPIANGQGSGSSIFDRQFLGFRFFVAAPVTTETIGAHLIVGTPIFAALVALDDAQDFPDSTDLSTPDLVAVGILQPLPPGPADSSEVYTQLVTPLGRGWHALVLGAGLFGTAGESGTALPFGPSDHLFSGFVWVSPETGFRNMQTLPGFAPRVVVYGQTSPVPEPATLTLLGVGLAGLGVRQWRQRQAPSS